MKSFTMTICKLLFFTLILTGCAQSPAENPVPDEPPEAIVSIPEPSPDPELEEEIVGDDENHTYPKINMVFDFAEFPEDDFPRGEWTVNQLIKKYGEPEEISAYYFPVYGLVRVDFIHQDIRVIFFPEYVDQFSFYDKILLKGDAPFSDDERSFDLNECDRNLSLGIMDTWFFSEGIEFPYGLKIGSSIMRDVLEAYPSDTAYIFRNRSEDYYYDMVSYFYAFHDENGDLPEFPSGSVDYFFDKDEMLYRVDVSWTPGD